MMNTPVYPPEQHGRERAITDIIRSVAKEQEALSRILQAEGAKLEAIIAMEDHHGPGGGCEQDRYERPPCHCHDDDEACGRKTRCLLEANRSVERMVRAITRLEQVLESKLELFGDCLCPEEEDDPR